MNAPIVWFEVIGTDAQSLQSYYQQLFGGLDQLMQRL